MVRSLLDLIVNLHRLMPCWRSSKPPEKPRIFVSASRSLERHEDPINFPRDNSTSLHDSIIRLIHPRKAEPSDNLGYPSTIRYWNSFTWSLKQQIFASNISNLEGSCEYALTSRDDSVIGYCMIQLYALCILA